MEGREAGVELTEAEACPQQPRQAAAHDELAEVEPVDPGNLVGRPEETAANPVTDRRHGDLEHPRHHRHGVMAADARERRAVAVDDRVELALGRDHGRASNFSYGRGTGRSMACFKPE